MSVLTPSAVSSGFAGVGFWAIVWACLFKVDSIPFVNKFVSKQKIFSKINKQKALSLTGTEVVNFTIHGISNPLAVTMAIGGTIINAIMIFFVVPFMVKKPKEYTGLKAMMS
jgi:hypothetical protein